MPELQRAVLRRTPIRPTRHGFTPPLPGLSETRCGHAPLASRSRGGLPQNPAKGEEGHGLTEAVRGPPGRAPTEVGRQET